MTCTLLVGKYHRLQHVHHLSDICHFHAVGILMEDVQRQRSHKGITQSILLIKMTADGARFLVPPCAPLINEQSHGILRILLVHDGLVALDNLLNLQALTQCPVILIGIKLRCRTLRTIPTRTGIVMQTDALHAVTNLIHQYLRPLIVVVTGTTTNAIEFVACIVAQIGVELTELVRVVLRRHVTTAAPSLVTNTEVLHVPSLLATILTTQTGHGCITVARHILHPLGHLLHRATAHVTTDIWLAVQHFTKVQELMRTKRVVLDGAAPVVVA